MNRSRIAAMTLGVLACLGGCSKIAIYVEHDPSVSFAGLHTWAWASPNPPEEVSDILDARIRDIVEREMARRKLTLVPADAGPDCLVAYSAAVEHSVQSVTIDRYAGYTSTTTYLRQSGTSRDRPRSTLGQQTVVYEYQQGSLVLDVSLPEPRRLIWRASARAVIDPHETQAQRDARLEEAVKRMLAGFPPR